MTRPRKFTRIQEIDIFDLWIGGKDYSEIAENLSTYRQIIRNTVLSFDPTPAQYATHELWKRNKNSPHITNGDCWCKPTIIKVNKNDKI